MAVFKSIALIEDTRMSTIAEHKNIIKYPFILRLFIFVFYKLIKIENIINRLLMNKVSSSHI